MSRYVKTKVDGRDRDVHRATMERVLGRPLLRKEWVHHRDLDPRNNDPDNLEVMSPLEHNRHHHAKYPPVKPCAVCGEDFEPKPSKRLRAKTCSRKCQGELRRRHRLADLASPARGRGSVRARLDEAQVRQILLLKGHASATSVGAQFEVSPSAITMIWQRKRWRHVEL